MEKNNEEKIKAVGVYDNASTDLPSTFQEMLDKLMSACKFNTNEISFLNIKANEVSVGQLQSCFNPELILLFGEMTGSKNMTKLQKNISYELNGTKIIRTESLENLERIKGEKGKLWEVLKQTLGIES
ncbi:MAG: hypothetical protein NTY88_08860 [Bacteroidetes bacterium]|nr:hypothetical protein [Bacteroidota bacterium]